jgi:protein phosphatase
MPNRNVLTMAVGTFEHVLVRTHIEQVQPGDRILLCSDGLHGPVSNDAIIAIIGNSMGLQDKVEKLIHTANENGGPDNITAVLLEFGDED